MGCELSRSSSQTKEEKDSKNEQSSKKKRMKSDGPSKVKRPSTTPSLTDDKIDSTSSKNDPKTEKKDEEKDVNVLDSWSSDYELTNKQKDLIEETWKVLVDSIAEVGVITFMKLFETHPDVQQAFLPFKELSDEELQFSRELRAHALRVMGFVQKVVARLREPKEKTESLLRTLGASHVAYGAKEQYVDLIGPQFVFAIKPSFEEQWSNEVEEAWLQLFRYMSDIMKDSMKKTAKPGNKDVYDGPGKQAVT